MNLLNNFHAARILVAERDHTTMDTICSILEDASYRVSKAYFPDDALFSLNNDAINVALIDVDMSVRLGPSLNIPWIALVDENDPSGYNLLDQGASALIPRPIQPETLLATVRAVEMHPPPIVTSLVANTGLLTRKGMLPSTRSAEELNTLLKQRLIELQTLSSLARSLSAELDINVLLTLIVDAAARLCHAEEGLLLLPDEDGQTLWIRAMSGMDSETARNFRIKTSDTLAGQVFHSGRPIAISDQGPQKVKTEYLVKSLLYVPLSLKGNTLGVLGVSNKNVERAFTQYDLDLLQDLAAHAAVALENARLYEESVLRARELSTLVKVSEAANSTLDINQVLASIAEHALNALDASQCHICEWNAGENRLEVLAVRQQSCWVPGDRPSWAISQSVPARQALTQRRAVIQHCTTSDLPRDTPLSVPPGVLDAWLPINQTKSCALIPLFVHDYLLGMLALYRIYEPFSDQNLPNLLPLQQQGREIALGLTDEDMRPHLHLYYRSAQALLDQSGTDWCEVALWNSARERFELALSFGSALWQNAPRPGFDLAHFPQLVHALTSQQPITVASTPDLLTLQDLGHSKDLLVIPLVIKGTTAGLVTLSDTLQGRIFARREVQLAQAVVLQAANALDNARLYRDLQTSLEELHRTQSMLVQTARLSAMGELAAAVAHQINNPLTTILGDAELILQDLPDDDINRTSVEAIARAGKRAHEVVRRLLTMARQQHSDDRAATLVEVNSTIHNTLTLVRSHVQQGGVTLTVSLQNDLPPILAMPDELEDVWLNLLLNARDAVTNRPNPQIGISTAFEPETNRIRVTIWDNGIGISEEIRAHIFEPFFTTKPAGEGTGLGLHICQQIITKCKGSISVQSAYNEGAEFVVYLPVYSQRDES